MMEILLYLATGAVAGVLGVGSGSLSVPFHGVVQPRRARSGRHVFSHWVPHCGIRQPRL